MTFRDDSVGSDDDEEEDEDDESVDWQDAITSLEDDGDRIGGDEKDDDDGSDGAGKNRWRRK